MRLTAQKMQAGNGPMNQILLADVINWVGVAVGLTGAIVVAPSGFSEFARELLASVQRLFPRKPGIITGSLNLSLPKPSVRAYAHVAMSRDLPQQELLDQLVQRVNDLSAQMSTVQQAFDKQHDELRREIKRIEAGSQRSDAEIRKLMADAELQNAKFNARGLPLIALGIVMTGPTDILAEYAPVGWIFVALGACSVIYGVWPWLPRLFSRTKNTAAVAPTSAEISHTANDHET